MNYLSNLKESYLKVEAPLKLKADGWDQILNKIGRPEVYVWGKRFAFALASLFIFTGMLFGLYTSAKASVLGEPLYPVKRFAEGIFVKATGNRELVTQNRAQEIVDLAKKKEADTQKLNETVKEYVSAVSEVKKDTSEVKSETDNHQKVSSFDERLQEQHKQFDELSREHPEVKDNIESAVNASEVRSSGD